MCIKKPITASTEHCCEQIEKLKSAIKTADAILIGAGAGMSSSAGFAYDGERFEKNFSDFRKKYGFTDMYTGGFYPYNSLEEYWAWWSRHILLNRYDVPAGKPYTALLRLVKNKDYFVLTTNVDHQFQLAGFDKATVLHAGRLRLVAMLQSLSRSNLRQREYCAKNGSGANKFENSNRSDSQMSCLRRTYDHESAMRYFLCAG